ncbi:Fumarylacetoacetase [Aspergillus heterothallicus]
MTSWIDTGDGSGFYLDVLPYGIFSTESLDARIGVAIGCYILDLKALAQEGFFTTIDFDSSTIMGSTLNDYAALGKQVHKQVRNLLQELLAHATPRGAELRDNQDRRDRVLVKRSQATLHLPMSIGDYTDFFVGPYHAQNPGSTLHRNYLNQPIGYHGRASSVVISGTPIRRPKGQFLLDNNPIFGDCQKLDFEVEFAAFIGQGSEHGSAIPVDEAEDHIFGFVIMNDWSARDIQNWESSPLGPFNGKNFATTISPWVVPLEALEPFREHPISSRPLLPYLQQKRDDSVYSVPITVSLNGKQLQSHEMFECNTKYVVFSFAQMLAHHTAGGCPLRTGDLIATGTLSGPSCKELGCLLEATKNGSEPYELHTSGPETQNIVRRYLEDGDIIELRASGFGSCSGRIVSLE